MTAQYSVTADPARDLIRITLSGFFGADDLAAFGDSLAAAHRNLTCGANRHVTLVDASAMKVQSQDTVAAFRGVLADPAFHSRRLAFVVDPTLLRSQVRRALDGRAAQSFGNTAAAEAWLFAAEPDTAAA
ncbi:hypothetical protein [Sphingomonas panacisoli]|nr:hypothetical protein [Sphingomonas panacisoli]